MIKTKKIDDNVSDDEELKEGETAREKQRSDDIFGKTIQEFR